MPLDPKQDMGYYTRQSLTNYKVYTALLEQTGTAAPIATILKNTLGDITWTRLSPGNYAGQLNGAFTANKTLFLDATGLGGAITFYPLRSDNDYIALLVTNDGTPTDTWTYYNLEIRVYQTT